jgi:hypothetical protein
MQGDGEFTIAMGERDLVQTLLTLVFTRQNHASIRVDGHSQAHLHAGEHPYDPDATPIEINRANPSLGTRIGNRTDATGGHVKDIGHAQSTFSADVPDGVAWLDQCLPRMSLDFPNQLGEPKLNN